MPESNQSDFTDAPFPRKDFTNNWNEAIDAIRQTRDSYASNFTRGFGPLARHRRGLIVRDIFIGKIDTTGPTGDEDDYTDARYWIDREVPKASLQTGNDGVVNDDNFDTDDDPIAPNNGLLAVVTAYNLAELPEGGPQKNNTGSHILSAGTLILCTGIVMPANVGTILYVFERSPEPVMILIGSAATRPGAYNANVFGGPNTAPDVSGSSALSSSDFGSTGVACYAFNAAEIGNSATPTHWLSGGEVFLGTWIGVTTDGTPCFMVGGYDSLLCT